MNPVGNLVVRLSADIDTFVRGMARSATVTEENARRIEETLSNIKDAIPAIGAAAVAAGAALALMVRDAIAGAANLDSLSQKTGVAVEKLNGLAFTAQLAGKDVESLADGLKDLNEKIAEAAGGNEESGQAFKALGISVTDTTGKLKAGDVVLAEIADKFEQYADGPEKTILAIRMMGDAGADMIAMLNKGGDALRENTEYTEKYSGQTKDLTDNAIKFNATMAKLQVQQQGFTNELTKAVLPILRRVADETLNAAEQSDRFSLATKAIRTVLQTFIVVGSEVAFTFKGVGTEIGGIAAQLGRLASGDIKGFRAISTAMKEDAERARVEHDKFIADILADLPVAPLPEKGGLSDKPTDKKPPPPRLPNEGDAAAAKAMFSRRLKVIDDALASERDVAAFHAQFIEGLRAQDLVDLETTQAYKARMIEEGLSSTLRAYDAQIALLEKQRAASKKVDEQAELSNQIAEKRTAKDRARLDAMQANALLELDIARMRYEEEKRLEEERLAQVQQNEAEVANIALSLESVLEAETNSYNQRLSALMVFRDERLENEERANALIEQENRRHAKVLSDIQQSNDMEALGMAVDVADQIYQVMKNAGKEKTALAKALFLAQKAFAVAEIIVNTEKGAAAALGMGPFGIPMSSLIRGLGYASAGIVAGTAIAEISAEGGYDIPAGVNPIVQTHEQEMILPKEHANVIRGLARNGGAGGGMKLTVVNTGTPQRVVQTQKVSDGEWAAIVEDAVEATAAQLSDPNSRTSRALGRHYQMQRSR